MAILPTDIPTGLVTGQFYFVNEDNVDANTDPELTVVQGNVTFTCSAPLLRMPTKLATVIPLSFKAQFDSNGNLVSASDPSIGLKLPATDSSMFNPTGFTWHVSFSLTQAFNGYTIQVAPFDIQVPAGGTVDLTTVMPVSTAPGVLTVQGPPGTGDDSFIAAQVNNSASSTRGALNHYFAGYVNLAKNPDMLIAGAVTVDSNNYVTSAAVLWPDGSPGTLTITSRDTNGAVLGYNISYGSPVTKTYTQPTITRNAAGAATNVPQIVVT